MVSEPYFVFSQPYVGAQKTYLNHSFLYPKEYFKWLQGDNVLKFQTSLCKPKLFYSNEKSV